jgi:hypothetical protein
VHLYTSVRAQAQDSWDFKSLSLRGADVGSGHSVGGGHSEAHDNPVDSGHPSTHPPLIPTPNSAHNTRTILSVVEM